jgi:hypothetical protein
VKLGNDHIVDEELTHRWREVVKEAPDASNGADVQ